MPAYGRRRQRATLSLLKVLDDSYCAENNKQFTAASNTCFARHLQDENSALEASALELHNHARNDSEHLPSQ